MAKRNRRQDLLWRARSWPVLHGAARLVLSKATQSLNRDIAEEARAFQSDLGPRLNRLKWQLDRNQFEFAPSHGFLKKKTSGAQRPIVTSRIEDKIVRRSLLDVLQSIPAVRSALESPYSFGGIEGRSVREAVFTAADAIQKGATYFIRTDIQDFFRHVPRQDVLDALASQLRHPQFSAFLTQACTTELDNLAALRDHASLFPLDEDGVAQGSALSPLVANLALSDFDRTLNGRGIVTIRYLDDLLMLGRRRRDIEKAFRQAQLLLSTLSPNLRAYDPWNSVGKADHGNCSTGIEFLGCEIHPDRISPGRRTRTKLLKRIADEIGTGQRYLRMPPARRQRQDSLLRTLGRISNVVEGWAKQYEFCSDDRLMHGIQGMIDQKVATLLRSGLGRVSRSLAKGSTSEALADLGMFRIV